VIFTTFGDAMRVPGSRKSLLQAKADGSDVRIVYSPMDALALAHRNPTREVVFFGLGFETTMPSTALTIIQAEADGTSNFSVFCNHITIVPTIKAILDSPDMQLDGFVGPGHVSMVIGTAPYAFIADVYKKPVVVGGF
jgi:hydrogenase expression/formation protein HypD